MRTGQAEDLAPLETAFLVVPAVAGFVFGLLPLLIPAQFASVSGFPGNDMFVYRLAGAATLGYGVALVPAIRERRWLAVRPIVAAVLVFNVASLYACIVAIAEGSATWIVYLITAASVLLSGGTALLLARHRAARSERADTLPLLAVLLAVLSALALVTGLLPIIVPVQYGQLFGFKATDVFLYRQAGAATLGYAVMGAIMISSRRWSDICWPMLMATVFNAVAFVVSLLYLVAGGAFWAPWIIGPASLFAAGVGVWALATRGGQ